MNQQIAIGTIYKITCDETFDVYIGSTSKTIQKRLAKHKVDYKQRILNKIKKNITSFKIVRYDSAKIETISTHHNVSKRQLHEIERCAIENEPNAVNKTIPTRTYTTEEMIDYRRKYRTDNRDRSSMYRAHNLERMTEHHPCECGGRYNNQHKTRHMQSKQHHRWLNDYTNTIVALYEQHMQAHYENFD
jgi:Uri superfamily endonuclease